MSNDKARSPVDENCTDESGIVESDAAEPANVHLHPATVEAASELIAALAEEVRGWMADEIEELAEHFEDSADSGASGPTTGDVHELSDKLARQADMLGYPKIVEIAGRLKHYYDSGLLDEVQPSASVGDQIAELRAAING